MKGYKTYAGIAILAIPVILKTLFDFDVTSEEIEPILENFYIGVGSILAILGRYYATK